MKHPDRQAWLGFLYQDELPENERNELARHLESCPACRAQVQSWRAVGSALSSLPDPAPALQPALQPPARRRYEFAAAAALVALGVALGHFLLPSGADTASLKAALLQAVRAEVQAELARSTPVTETDFQRFLATFAGNQALTREQDLRELYAAITRVDRQRAADAASLRKDMETVAVMTDASFRRTSEKLVQLASYGASQ